MTVIKNLGRHNHTEAQHFALVQNVVEMQNQVAEMEIEV
jgi:hypothetical protein